LSALTDDDRGESLSGAEANSRAGVTIVGAGAAGLMAAVWAARSIPMRRIVLLDGAQRIGAKILIAGGGRCNVTHDRVGASAFAGSSPNSVRKVLRRFDVPQTVGFFESLGVRLKREDTGKLFPVTDRARTVLDALLGEVKRAGVTVLHPRRVDSIARRSRGFEVSGPWGLLEAERVVLATGGRSVPKTGSDGLGYEIARSLGHTVTPLFPALVPLTLPKGHFLTTLSGVSAEATLDVLSSSGKSLASFTGSVLCAHFGLTGPAVLDISRHYIAASMDDAEASLVISWLPGTKAGELERDLVSLGAASVAGHLARRIPGSLAEALCAAAGVDPKTPGHKLRREDRKAVALTATRMRLPVTGNRGFDHAEATAGGVPLAEIRLDTMESRVCPGLYLCGEICDVDGRIGGFNFQWAWASGYVAGVAAGRLGDRP
jgi:predicted Rossmann fold flavoprotein